MKLFGKTVFILMFGLLPASLVAADQASHPADESNNVAIEEFARQTMNSTAHNNLVDDNKVNIIYLLDKDGKPYIISIHSEDEQVNQMIRNMIRNEQDADAFPMTNDQDKSLGITFYYNNIR